MSRNYFNIAGRVALVTGASSGLGVHFARVLAAEGGTVILAARRAGNLADEVEAIRAEGGSASAVTMDVTSADSFFAISSHTGCVALMIGRGAIGNPWLFSQIAARLEGRTYSPPGPRERV